ncbi:hypothetical protein K1719_036982 [Acacia pycnantha]|nr:hypothetical protein K1719_036982 [Acacia pycnantha]
MDVLTLQACLAAVSLDSPENISRSKFVPASSSTVHESGLGDEICDHEAGKVYDSKDLTESKSMKSLKGRFDKLGCVINKERPFAQKSKSQEIRAANRTRRRRIEKKKKKKWQAKAQQTVSTSFWPSSSLLLGSSSSLAAKWSSGSACYSPFWATYPELSMPFMPSPSDHPYVR